MSLTKLMQRSNKVADWPTVDFLSAEENETQKYHSWYSEQHKKHSGSIIYLNEDSKEIEVTGVTTSAMPTMRFTDIEYKGVVVKWVRRVRKSLSFNIKYICENI